jgi:CRP-like cAMP-binding protein
MALNEFLKLLKSITIFNGLDDQVILRLVSYCKEVKVAKGKYLFKEGTASDAVYILLTGKLVISQGANEIGQVQPREIVGEMGVFSGMPRSADVKASEDCEILQLPKLDLRKFVDSEKDAGLRIYENVIRVMAKHLRDRNFVVEAESLLDDYITINEPE